MFWASSKPDDKASPLPTQPNAEAEACPVDHKTRQAWLDQAKRQREAENNSQPATQTSKPQSPPSLPAGESCDSSAMDQTTSTPRTSILSSLTSPLGTHREISTIPRALSASPTAPAAAAASAQQSPPQGHAKSSHAPSNAEAESGTSASGHWIYPSEKMFFDAMRRKNYDPQAADMSSIVPIHNAVNERAWAEILRWERHQGGFEGCGGPKLVSFSGDSSKLTPKARINSLLGYTAPFDRHDWVVDRCGTRVEYVIDFYAGRDEGKPGKSLNFYLDVRPKLNTWEGWRMRAERLVGLK